MQRQNPVKVALVLILGMVILLAAVVAVINIATDPWFDDAKMTNHNHDSIGHNIKLEIIDRRGELLHSEEAKYLTH